MYQLAVKQMIAAFMAAMNALKTGEAAMMPSPSGGKVTPSAAAVGRAKQTQTVITGLVVVIVASLAVIVVDRFDQSLGTPSSNELSTAQDSVLSGFADMLGLVGPLLLVLIAVVIVGVVQRLRG